MSRLQLALNVAALYDADGLGINSEAEAASACCATDSVADGPAMV